jgi:hypothetical protein
VVSQNAVNHLDEGACCEVHRSEKAREVYRKLFERLRSMAAPKATIVLADCSRHNVFAKLGVRNPLAPSIEWEKHQAPATWRSLLEQVGFSFRRVDWHPYYPLRFLGRVASNRVASFLLTSQFRLVMEAPEDCGP